MHTNTSRVPAKRKRTLAAAFGLALLTTTVMTPAKALAEGKIALVIGNSQYQKVTKLTNPANDSSDVASSLKRLGFDVNLKKDLDFDAFRKAIIEFGNAAKTADMAVIFYAGHGAEIDGKNWLIPVDAEIKSEVNVYAEAINLEMLIDISVMPKVVGLIVLDACRNNPFIESIAAAGRSLSAKRQDSGASIAAVKATSPKDAPVEMVKGTEPAILPLDPTEPPMSGLAPVEPADNVLVAFSAAAGTTANDGAGRNSPYSGALLRHVETPGLEINYLFRNVHDDVVEETKEQQPALYGTLSKDEIYFQPGQPGAMADDAEAERLTWPYIRATNDVTTLRKFVEQFPSSTHLDDVRARITQLEGAERFAWTIVERQNTTSAYRAFTEMYPSSGHVEEAKTRMASLDQGGQSDASPVDLPKPPAPEGRLGSEIPAVGKSIKGNNASVEKAWEILQSSRDQNIVMSFAESFPSAQRRKEVAERFRRRPDGTESVRPFVNPTQWMLDTANDAEVNRCFRGRPEDSQACLRAMERYPDFVQLRFQLCKTAGHPNNCMREAVEDAREQGYLTSAYTRSEKEKVRNKQYQAIRTRVEEAAGRAASNAASVAASTAASAAASAASSAASMAASRAGSVNVAVPSIAPRGPAALSAPVGIRIPGSGRWNGQLASLRGSLQGGAAGGAAIAAPGGVRAVPGATVRVPGVRGGPAVAVRGPSGVNVPGVGVKTPGVNVRAPGVTVRAPHVRVPGSTPRINVAGPHVRVPGVKVPSTSVPTIRVPR